MTSAYRQFTDQIAADASQAAATIPHPPSFSWLAGEWTWLGQPALFAKTLYGVSLNAQPFLIHHAEAGMWILVLADPDAFGILIGCDMLTGEARFSGDVTNGGQPVRLRQTWRRDEEFAVEIVNERFSDNRWQRWDRSRLVCLTPPNWPGGL